MMERRLKPFIFLFMLIGSSILAGCSHWGTEPDGQAVAKDVADERTDQGLPERTVVTDEGSLSFATIQLASDEDDMLLELKLDLHGPPDPHWVHNSRHYVGRVFGDVTASLDTYIADDETQVKNQSYLRLRLSQTWQDGGNMISKSDIRFYVDLPKSKDHIGFVFDTAPEEFESLEQQNRESATGDQQIRNSDSATAGLRFALDIWDDWSPNLDVGIQGGLPVNPFMRFRFSRGFILPDYWEMISQNALYYYYQDGGVQQSSLSFVRPLGSSLLFVNKWEMRWGHDKHSLTFANINSLTHAFDDRRVFTYRLGAFYEEKPDPHLSSYFIDVSYRHRLHEDWLYAELIPSLTWLEDENVEGFEDIAEITLRFEMFFRN